MLLEDAGRHLAELTEVAYRKAGFKGPVKIGLKGGIFYNSSIMLSAYKEDLHNRLRSYQIIEEDISATRAVCRIYIWQKQVLAEHLLCTLLIIKIVYQSPPNKLPIPMFPSRLASPFEPEPPPFLLAE